MTIEISTKRFWKWLTLFAYRRWSEHNSMIPVGIPGMRDPDSRCAAFEPRPRDYRDWGNCQTDGHYMCDECCHRVGQREEEEVELISLGLKD